MPAWEDYLDGVRKAGSSIGAVVALEVTGVPAGWGAPLYGKLDAELAAAMMSINAVKGVEIGAGFGAAELTGEDNADEMRLGDDGRPVFLSNHAGGVLGGISTGQPLTARVAFKPTSSILTPRQTITRDGDRDRAAHQGPPRPLRRPARRAGGRGDGRLRAGRRHAEAPGAGGLAMTRRRKIHPRRALSFHARGAARKIWACP